MTPPRIAIIADKFPPNWGGGVASAHYQLYRVLRADGVAVRAFCFADPTPNRNDENGICRRSVPRAVARALKRANNLLFKIIDPGAAAYQVADILVRVPGYLRLRAPLARYAPDITIVPDHGAAALFLAKRPGERRILVAHHNPIRFLDLPFVERHSARDVEFALALERRALRRIDKVVCPSSYMAGVFRETHPFAGPIAVVPNLIDQAFVDGVPANDPRPSLGLGPEAPMLYVPAGGNKFKGALFIEPILAALDGRIGEPFGVYVSGNVPADLRARLSGERVRVFAPGSLPADRVLGYAKTCTAGVYATLVENYSMALLEAALCGVPMVTFDVGGNREIIRHGTTGFLIHPFDLPAMIEATASLLAVGTAAPMSAQCLDDARARLSSPVIGPRWKEALGLAGQGKGVG